MFPPGKNPRCTSSARPGTTASPTASWPCTADTQTCRASPCACPRRTTRTQTPPLVRTLGCNHTQCAQHCSRSGASKSGTLTWCSHRRCRAEGAVGAGGTSPTDRGAKAAGGARLAGKQGHVELGARPALARSERHTVGRGQRVSVTVETARRVEVRSPQQERWSVCYQCR